RVGETRREHDAVVTRTGRAVAGGVGLGREDRFAQRARAVADRAPSAVESTVMVAARATPGNRPSARSARPKRWGRVIVSPARRWLRSPASIPDEWLPAAA